MKKKKDILRVELKKEPIEEDVWEGKNKVAEGDSHMDVGGEKVIKFSAVSLHEVIKLRRLTNLVYGAGVFDSILEEEVTEWHKFLTKDNRQIDISDDE